MRLLALAAAALAAITADATSTSLRSNRFQEDSQSTLDAVVEVFAKATANPAPPAPAAAAAALPPAAAAAPASLDLSIKNCKKLPISPHLFNSKWENRDFTLSLEAGKPALSWMTGKNEPKRVFIESGPSSTECGKYCSGVANCVCMQVNEKPNPNVFEPMYIACADPANTAKLGTLFSLMKAIAGQGWQTYNQFLGFYPGARNIKSVAEMGNDSKISSLGGVEALKAGPMITPIGSAKKNPAASLVCMTALAGIKQLNYDGVLSTLGMLSLLKPGNAGVAMTTAESAIPPNDLRIEIVKRVVSPRLKGMDKEKADAFFAMLQNPERPVGAALCQQMATLFWLKDPAKPAEVPPFQINLSAAESAKAQTVCTSGAGGAPNAAVLQLLLTQTAWASQGWTNGAFRPALEFTLPELTEQCGTFMELSA